MLKKNKKINKVENFFLKPKKTSHKKRNTLILGAVLALIFAGGATAKNQDQP